MGVGLALQAVGLTWIAIVATPTVPYEQLVLPVRHLGRRHGPLLRAGGERRPRARSGGRRKARHRARTMRSARSAASSGSPCWRPSSVRYGGYQSPQTFVDGLQVAIIVGAAVVAVGSLAAFAIPRAHRATAAASETGGDRRPGAGTGASAHRRLMRIAWPASGRGYAVGVGRMASCNEAVKAEAADDEDDALSDVPTLTALRAPDAGQLIERGNRCRTPAR